MVWLGHWKQIQDFSVRVTLECLCQCQALTASSAEEVHPKLEFMPFLCHVTLLSFVHAYSLLPNSPALF